MSIRLKRYWEAFSLPCLLVGAMLSHWGVRASLADELPNIETLHARYVQSVSSIQTMDCEYLLTGILPNGKQPIPKSMLNYQIRQVRDGIKQCYEVLNFSESGADKIRSWASFNGQRFAGWQLCEAHSVRGELILPSGQLGGSRPGEFGAHQGIDTFLGIRRINSLNGVGELLASPNAKVVAIGEIDGHRCVHVDLGTFSKYPNSEKVSDRGEVWLDPEQEYLPRRILITSLTRHGKGFYPFLEHTVLEFQKVSIGYGNRSLPIPKRGFVARPENSGVHFELKSITLNQPITPDVFEPRFPSGTLVSDQSIPGQRKQFVAGNKTDREQLEKQMEEEAKEVVAAESNTTPPAINPGPTEKIPVDASPVQSNRRSYWLMGIGIGCLVAALVIRGWFRTS